MKNKGILIATILFFLVVNTMQLWEAKMGLFALPVIVMLLIHFLALLLILIAQLVKVIQEKFKNKRRIYLVVFMKLVLITSFLFPSHLISYATFESNSLLIAEREGAANCMTTLTLKENNSFVERNVCFGISETTGKYRWSNDTIYFKDVSLGRHESEFYAFAILVNNPRGKYLGDIVRYKSKADTTGHALWISTNELKNSKPKG